MNSKIKNLIAQFSGQKVDSYLVTKDINIQYLTDFPASESWLFVTPKKTFYITDFRYILEAEKGLKGIEVVRYQNSLSETLFALASKTKTKTIGFDDRQIFLSLYNKLKKDCPKGIQLSAANGLCENLREIKTDFEIAQVKKALAIHQQALKYMKPFIKPGVSEKNLLTKLENFVKRKDVGFSFPPIIASGSNSCYPHAKVTDRKIKNNEPVLLDMGIDVNGYKSDLTRMFFLGKIPRFVREVNDAVKQSQLKAIQKIKANVQASEIDFEARNFLQKKGLDQYFGHSLGHGVGLEIHEGPSISSRSPSIVKERMIFTIEPAVYIPNKFGIRLEEMVLVTKDSCEVLSDYID